MRWSRWLAVLGLMVVALGACQRREEGDNPDRSRCRAGCKEALGSCVAACKNDAPQACEARCDEKNRRCYEKCE